MNRQILLMLHFFRVYILKRDIFLVLNAKLLYSQTGNKGNELSHNEQLNVKARVTIAYTDKSSPLFRWHDRS